MRRLVTILSLLTISSTVLAAGDRNEFSICQEKLQRIARSLVVDDAHLEGIKNPTVGEALATGDGFVVTVDGNTESKFEYRGIEIDFKTSEFCKVKSISIFRGIR